MSFFCELFGPLKKVAASGALTPYALRSVTAGLCANARASHGADWVAVTTQNTNSMLPTFDANAVLILESVPFSELREGDMVTYFDSRGMRIVHRLVCQVGDGWRAKGDNNASADPELVTASKFDRRVCAIFYGAKDDETDK